jgi:hypothetical protein
VGAGNENYATVSKFWEVKYCNENDGAVSIFEEEKKQERCNCFNFWEDK